MHVLMFGWEFPPHNSGGLGVACYGLTKALSQKQVEIDFVLPKNYEVDASFMHFLFADVVNLKIRSTNSLLHPYINASTYLTMLSNLTQKSIYGKDLFEEVDRYALEGEKIAKEVDGVDVIHSHDWLSFGAGMKAQEVSGRPLVVHVHATEFDRTGGAMGDERVHAIEQTGCQRANKIITVSGLTRDIVVNKYGIPATKVSVVHNGLDHGSYATGAPPTNGLMQLKSLGYKIVLFVGRITLSKGVDHLIYSARDVIKYDPKVLFVIAGSGEMERQIVQLTADLGISGNVIFAGWARGKELSGLYKAADLFVMPSVSEPFGLTALESLIHGTPIIISKQSGVSEVLTHALKVDFWDTDELTNKILTSLKYPSLRQTLAENGKAQAYGSSWDRAADKCVSIYNQLK